MQTNPMATKSALVVFLLTLGLAEIAAQNGDLAIDGNISELNLTSKADVFLNNSERQFLAVIKSLIEKLEAYKSKYDKQIETISTQSELIETRFLNNEENLISREFLSELNQYCLQKYKARLPLASTLNRGTTACKTAAESSYATIVSSATAAITTMNSYMSNQFKAATDNCKKMESNPPENYTRCITQAIEAGNANINAYRNSFNNEFEVNTCAGDFRVKQAVECSSNYVYNYISTTGEVMNLINNCIAGKEFCPPCFAPTDPTPVGCRNVVDFDVTQEIRKNATITNPFLNANIENSNCVEFRFIPN